MSIEKIKKKKLVNRRLKNTEEDKRDLQLLESVHRALDQPDQLSDEQRDKIRSEMGWFGKVLLSAGIAEGEPGAEEAVALRVQAMLMIVITGFLALAVTGVGVLGVGLLSVGLLMLRNGKLQLAGVTNEIPSQPYLGAFAMYLMLMVLAEPGWSPATC